MELEFKQSDLNSYLGELFGSWLLTLQSSPAGEKVQRAYLCLGWGFPGSRASRLRGPLSAGTLLGQSRQSLPLRRRTPP